MNQSIKIAVIDSVPKIHWEDDEGIRDGEKFVDLLSSQNSAAQFDIYYAAENQLPARIDDYDGFMLTGSPASVNDPFEWISRLSAFIKMANGQNKKIVASCFGHQLVAKTFGGMVGKNEEGWMIGNYPLAISKTFGWMQPIASETRIFHFNKERVTRLPEAAISFASCPAYRDFAYIIGDNILCIQGHPEQPLRAMNNFLTVCKDEIPAGEYLLALKMIDSGIPDASIWSEWMMHFFLESAMDH
ncbi:MAG: GMP synthase-like glutamine amidotransferase [Gammaproteobacteria bacterium]|jgi:GMP synthase-like glutamine amidotransferase